MRANGTLLHLSSLPSSYGIGALGKSAFSFVDFLSSAGVDYWQMLPIGVTSYGDSPYQSPSAFAGNPYFIDLDKLVSDGLLNKNELPSVVSDNIDYEWLYNTRYKVLKLAFSRFKADKAYKTFILENSEWLPDFALFMACKTKLGDVSWQEWPKQYKYHDKITDLQVEELKEDIDFWKFIEYRFNLDMCALKKYAAKKNVKLIGDIPIYVALDSADVWAHPELFKLDKNLKPKDVAGVPPDYFAAKGQLWGNPLYNWAHHAETDYAWWHQRLRHQLKYFDIIRIDHFRAFESYYSIPQGAIDATVGKWIKGVGTAVFDGIRDEIDGKVIAEDLGIITDKVRRLVKISGFPGMKVFQFAFDGKPDNEYLTKNFKTDNVVFYTGTHDNDTLLGWYESLDAKTRCAVIKEIGSFTDVIPNVLKKCMSSRANIVIVPMQDYLAEGSNARMNTPSTAVGNWVYRLPDDYNKCKKTITEAVKYR